MQLPDSLSLSPAAGSPQSRGFPAQHLSAGSAQQPVGTPTAEAGAAPPTSTIPLGCPAHGQVLKPDLGFFGEQDPKVWVERVLGTLASAPSRICLLMCQICSPVSGFLKKS